MRLGYTKMIKKIWKELVITLIVISGIWIALSKMPQPDGFDMSISQEKQRVLGEKILDELKQTRPEIKNAIIGQSVQKIEKRLLDAKKHQKKKGDETNTGKIKYRIIVLEDPMVNAFALPGGIIVVFSGLLDFIDSGEELAGVIAHEMGHIEKDHVIQKIYTRFGIALITRILTGNDPTIATEMGEMITENYFSRKKEVEADDYALNLLEAAQINPRVMAAFFKKIAKKENASWNIKVLSTHPDSNERYQNALLYEVSDDFEEKKFNINWKKIKHSL